MAETGSSGQSETENMAYLKPYLDMYLCISFIFISYVVYSDYHMGGDAWRQADWLIHNVSGYARRGLFGSALLDIFEYLDIGIILGLCILQISFTATLFISFRSLAYGIQNPAVAALILMSPAMFAIFWVADPGGAAGKELIIFTGLSLSALGVIRKNPVPLWIGSVIFSIGLIAHEAMLLFVPTFLAILWISGRHRKLDFHIYSVLVLVFLSFVFSLIYTSLIESPVNSNLMCESLLNQWIGGHMCEGAVHWIDKDLLYALEKLRNKLDIYRVLAYFVGYIISLVPFWYCLKISSAKKSRIKIIILTGCPFVILNFVALDWGRWISFHILSLSIIILCALSSGLMKINRGPDTRVVLASCSLALLISPTHVIALKVGGVVRALISTIA